MSFFRLVLVMWFCFFLKQKTAYEMRISDWSSDVCSSDLHAPTRGRILARQPAIDGRSAGDLVRGFLRCRHRVRRRPQLDSILRLQARLLLRPARIHLRVRRADFLLRVADEPSRARARRTRGLNHVCSSLDLSHRWPDRTSTRLNYSH